jgi:hypothetical protein
MQSRIIPAGRLDLSLVGSDDGPKPSPSYTGCLGGIDHDVTDLLVYLRI